MQMVWAICGRMSLMDAIGAREPGGRDSFDEVLGYQRIHGWDT
jgi:hypothetical protein